MATYTFVLMFQELNKIMKEAVKDKVLLQVNLSYHQIKRYIIFITLVIS